MVRRELIERNPNRSAMRRPGWNSHEYQLLVQYVSALKRTDLPAFRPGDTFRVHVKIKEGEKERLQAFEGTLIARHNTG